MDIGGKWGGNRGEMGEKWEEIGEKWSGNRGEMGWK